MLRSSRVLRRGVACGEACVAAGSGLMGGVTGLRRAGGGAARLREVAAARLARIRAENTWKHERVLTSPQQAEVQIAGDKSGVKLINFCSNNYLGLANHPSVVEASSHALRDFGAGLGSVRFICGTQTIHKDLEEQLASFHGREDAILYGSCFDANAALFEALLGPEDAVFSDELNHASIIDGIRLCKAQKFRYPHRDVAELERQLAAASGARLRLVATDGVFSMDGTQAPLAALLDAAYRHDALLFVDDCHATGFIGDTGRGSEEVCGVLGEVAVLSSTLGKALGGAAGGYTAGPRELVQLLRNVARPYLFSNAPPPPVVSAAAAALKVVTGAEGDSLRAQLRRNTVELREALTASGLQVRGDDHPICPVMLGDAALAAAFADQLLDEGVYAVGFSYPVVARGAARVRVQLSAAHTPRHVQHAAAAFAAVASRLRVV